MQYVATVTREGKHWLAEFPDCPGCQTFAESREELVQAATNALVGWLEAHLELGRVPPRPKHKARSSNAIPVSVPIRLAAAMMVRWARTSSDMSQALLARAMGVSQQQVAKLERPANNTSLEALERVAKATGAPITLAIALARRSGRQARKVTAAKGKRKTVPGTERMHKDAE